MRAKQVLVFLHQGSCWRSALQQLYTMFLSVKTRMSNLMQMSSQRQHILLSYFKTLSLGPVWGLNPRLPLFHLLRTSFNNKSSLTSTSSRQNWPISFHKPDYTHQGPRSNFLGWGGGAIFGYVIFVKLFFCLIYFIFAKKWG